MKAWYAFLRVFVVLVTVSAIDVAMDDQFLTDGVYDVLCYYIIGEVAMLLLLRLIRVYNTTKENLHYD